jgi:acyl carrier protein
MLEYYKTILEKVSFDRNLCRKEFEKATKDLNEKEIIELKEWLQNKGFTHKMNDQEIYNKLINIFVEMGYPMDKITTETIFETDLGFDYLDLADFLARIERDFEIIIVGNIIPNIKYPQFESIEATIASICENPFIINM